MGWRWTRYLVPYNVHTFFVALITPQTFYRYYPVAERDRNWGLYITTVGESRLAPGSAYPPAGHPKGYDFRASTGRVLSDHQVVYISAGRGWLRSGKKSAKIELEAGEVFLLFPGVWHSYAPLESTGWHEHWVGFDGEMARRLYQHGFFSPSQPTLRPGNEDQLQAWFTEMLEVTRGSHPALQQILSGIVHRILALLFSAQQSELAGDDRALQVIQKALGKMREHADRELDLPGLAHELSVSYSWFRRAFAHHTGLSPHQYLLEVRLARARDLLSHTTLPMKEIAVKTGFEDAQYFSRIFRKKVGVTPGAWRTRAHKGNA